ncbi:hypothetical protein Hypma_010800 [Hypsizygus marmoreus]|uniref:Uncharacterized protein n=1 Tax=Hypsizygus marmoreus TaxID=39966 RepID=A0A369JTI8_HYPMA|nr:hypothetical protein Hypma_010800 [Hypsizygus marmoreus]
MRSGSQVSSPPRLKTIPEELDNDVHDDPPVSSSPPPEFSSSSPVSDDSVWFVTNDGSSSCTSDEVSPLGSSMATSTGVDRHVDPFSRRLHELLLRVLREREEENGCAWARTCDEGYSIWRYGGRDKARDEIFSPGSSYPGSPRCNEGWPNNRRTANGWTNDINKDVSSFSLQPDSDTYDLATHSVSSAATSNDEIYTEDSDNQYFKINMLDTLVFASPTTSEDAILYTRTLKRSRSMSKVSSTSQGPQGEWEQEGRYPVKRPNTNANSTHDELPPYVANTPLSRPWTQDPIAPRTIPTSRSTYTYPRTPSDAHTSTQTTPKPSSPALGHKYRLIKRAESYLVERQQLRSLELDTKAAADPPPKKRLKTHHSRSSRRTEFASRPASLRRAASLRSVLDGDDEDDGVHSSERYQDEEGEIPAVFQRKPPHSERTPRPYDPTPTVPVTPLPIPKQTRSQHRYSSSYPQTTTPRAHAKAITRTKSRSASIPVPIIAPPSDHAPRLPQSEEACAKVRLGRYVERERGGERGWQANFGGMGIKGMKGVKVKQGQQRMEIKREWERRMGTGKKLRMGVVKWLLEVTPELNEDEDGCDGGCACNGGDSEAVRGGSSSTMRSTGSSSSRSSASSSSSISSRLSTSSTPTSTSTSTASNTPTPTQAPTPKFDSQAGFFQFNFSLSTPASYCHSESSPTPSPIAYTTWDAVSRFNYVSDSYTSTNTATSTDRTQPQRNQHHSNLGDQLATSPETRFHAVWMFLTYFAVVGAGGGWGATDGLKEIRSGFQGERGKDMDVEDDDDDEDEAGEDDYGVDSEVEEKQKSPHMDDEEEGRELVTWDTALACLALSVKYHRDFLSPLLPVYAHEFEALLEGVGYEDLETSQRDVLAALAYTLGGTPQGIIDELWVGVPSLREVLECTDSSSAGRAWNWVQGEMWGLLFDSLFEPDVLRFSISILTTAALAEALIGMLVRKYEYESEVGWVERCRVRSRRLGLGKEGDRTRWRERLERRAEREIEGVLSDVQVLLGISDARLRECRRWLRNVEEKAGQHRTPIIHSPPMSQPPIPYRPRAPGESIMAYRLHLAALDNYAGVGPLPFCGKYIFFYDSSIPDILQTVLSLDHTPVLENANALCRVLKVSRDGDLAFIESNETPRPQVPGKLYHITQEDDLKRLEQCKPADKFKLSPCIANVDGDDKLMPCLAWHWKGPKGELEDP